MDNEAVDEQLNDTEVRLVALLKAYSPMLVSEAGIDMDVMRVL